MLPSLTVMSFHWRYWAHSPRLHTVTHQHLRPAATAAVQEAVAEAISDLALTAVMFPVGADSTM